jgi:hypothetical protein
MPRIMDKLGWGISGAVALALLATLAGVIYAGPLDPPRPPAPTQSNLIYQPASCAGFPITLSAPGSYAFAENITIPAACFKTGIDFAADGVTLDLRGFTLRGAAGAQMGINVPSLREGLVIANGIVRDWPNGGVDISNSLFSRVSHLQIIANGLAASYGGQLQVGWDATVSDCQVASGVSGAIGIVAVGNRSVVRDCTVSQNAAQGIKVLGVGNRIAGNHVIGNNTTDGCADIWIVGPANVVEDNTAGFGSIDSCTYYLESSATGSILHRNVAQGGVPNYVSFCGACDIGPISSAAAATSPWANISD